MATKPIKRNKNLIILSREHHFGLLFCWKIRQGIKKDADPERIKKYVSFYWNGYLHKHFDEEENYMFLKVKDDGCHKALEQHQEIKRLINQITDGVAAPGFAILNKLADQVEAHIRFEERELFPHLEKVLNEQELKDIGTALEQSHAVPPGDNYPDAFWTNK